MPTTMAPPAPATTPIERVTRLRPSEALLLGRLTLPRRHRHGYYDNGRFASPATTAACAIGVMAIATPYASASRMWARLNKQRTTAPCEHFQRPYPYALPVAEIVAHLNDAHTLRDWPDRRIAEWLAGLGL